MSVYSLLPGTDGRGGLESTRAPPGMALKSTWPATAKLGVRGGRQDPLPVLGCRGSNLTVNVFSSPLRYKCGRLRKVPGKVRAYRLLLWSSFLCLLHSRGWAGSQSCPSPRVAPYVVNAERLRPRVGMWL